MLHRTLLAATLLGLLIGTLAPSAVYADARSDCMAGQRQIKAALKKKQPPEVQDRLKRALASIETEIMENDWSECVDYVAQARQALRQK